MRPLSSMKPQDIEPPPPPYIAYAKIGDLEQAFYEDSFGRNARVSKQWPKEGTHQDGFQKEGTPNPSIWGLVEWFKNGCKKIKITRIAQPISEPQVKAAIDKALADSATARAEANEISNGLSQAKIQELQNHLDAANHTINCTNDDYASRIQELQNHLNTANHTINCNNDDYAARIQELQKQLETANLTINIYKNQAEDFKKSLDEAKTAAHAIALEHQREISQLEKQVFTAKLATKDAEIVALTARLEDRTSKAELECNAAVMKEKIIQLQGPKQPRRFFDANRSVSK